MLKAANGCNAKYLFDPRKNGAQYDLGDGSYTCGRRTDAIKFWAQWKFYGIEGIAKMVEDKADAIKSIDRKIVDSDNFMLACETWAFNANFFYLPERIRNRLIEAGVDLKCNDPDIPHDIAVELADIHVQLKLRLHQSGKMMIPYQPLSNQEADCFRIVLAGKKSFAEEDIDNALALMHKYGHDL